MKGSTSQPRAGLFEKIKQKGEKIRGRHFQPILNYEVVTTELGQVNTKGCKLCPNGDLLQIGAWFLGGGSQAAFWGKSPFCTSAHSVSQSTPDR